MGHVDLAVEYGLDQRRHLGGEVLSVGVEGDHDRRIRVDHQTVAGPECGATAPVDDVAGDDAP